MNPLISDAIVRPRFIDADRLTLPLELLDYSALVMPACLVRLDDEDNEDIRNAIIVFNMARAELHRLQDQAKVEGQP